MGQLKDRSLELGAGVWGFAEATFFFVVPDVLLTAIALQDLRRAFLCCVLAAVTALAGGLIMFAWGAHDPTQATAFLDWIPSISPRLITLAGDEVRERGLEALFLAPLQGQPYKIFAVQAGQVGVSLPGFMVVSLLSRLSRFALLTAAAGLCRKTLLRRLSLRSVVVIHLAAWTAFYAIYFSVMPN